VARFWAARKGLRVAIAVVAAYAVALQMLLASIAPAHLLTGAVSSAADFTICQGDPGTHPGSSVPSHQTDHCPPCILSSLAGTLPTQLRSSWLVPATITSFIPVRATAAFVAVRHPTPRLSQGPPASA